MFNNEVKMYVELIVIDAKEKQDENVDTKLTPAADTDWGKITLVRE